MMDLSDDLRRLADEQRAKKPRYNEAKTRYITPAFLGWVCYEGHVRPDGMFEGRKAGLIQDDAAASRWLEGEVVPFDDA